MTHSDAITLTDDLMRALCQRANVLTDGGNGPEFSDILMRHRYSREEYIGRKLKDIGAGLQALSTVARALSA